MLEHRQGEPVDLEEDDPGRARHRLAPLPLRDPLDHAERVLVVVVGPDQDLEDERDRGHDQRGEQRVAEGVHGDQARQQRVGDQDRDGIGGEYEQEAEQERERQPERRDHGRQEGVDDGDGRSDEKGADRALQAEAADDPGGDIQRGRGHDP